ncbi:isoprenoid synthase domain-containing protein [Roridomyces roridus]|uniref:Terpene synthase n=1 Tax=Roridomyces roridus TaxID=1738132 RepID=A0AAD7BXC4_9AGAR|nr:isoprenoid synthase domain-containing protein [Roridomyces roridus]
MSSAPSSALNQVQETSFILPDLVSHCHYSLIYHPDGDVVAQQSVDWLDSACPELSAKQRKALHKLKAGELTAYCYNSAPTAILRVISDFLNYLFHLDNISDGMFERDTEKLAHVVMNALWFPYASRPEETSATKLARDFWTRCISDAGVGTQARFKETLGLFFEAVGVEAQCRDSGIVPDLESCISLRRDTSGCKPCWVLIDHVSTLPDFVVEHPVIGALNQSTNDLVTWSNDIFSYNVKQSRGDTHNMIVILMKYHEHTLQSAVDYVGELCRETIDSFQRNRRLVPSWGTEIDSMVQRYIRGLESWIVGSLHWSFMTERYFGASGEDVKKTRVVSLLPKTPSS